MEPVVAGGPDNADASPYRCPAEKVANPDNIAVLEDGSGHTASAKGGSGRPFLFDRFTALPSQRTRAGRLFFQLPRFNGQRGMADLFLAEKTLKFCLAELGAVGLDEVSGKALCLLEHAPG
jgi:hypothetical protein